MSCGGSPRAVNAERPGEHGRWVAPSPPASEGATCVHAWRYRNAAGVVGGPTVMTCTGCGESHYATWAPDVTARRALPAAEPFIVGEAEWVVTPEEWLATQEERRLWQDPPLILDAARSARTERGVA